QSWPLCHGKLVPADWPIETIIELAHRGISGIAIILVGVLSYMVLKMIPHKRETKFLVVLSIGFILAQALIGAAAVMWGQNDFIRGTFRNITYQLRGCVAAYTAHLRS